MKNLISIEQLSELLGGKLWVKGDLKRIYLDRGYNTKKMSTKTFVWQNETGEFKVSCRIDCPSQHDSWIESQQKEIIESVLEHIDQVLFNLENPEADYYEEKEKAQEIKELLKPIELTQKEKNIKSRVEFLEFQIRNQSSFLNEKDPYAPFIPSIERVYLKSEKHADQQFVDVLPRITIGKETITFDDNIEWLFSTKRGKNGPNKKNVFIPASIPNHIQFKINEVLKFQQDLRKKELAKMVLDYKVELEHLTELA